MRDIIRQTSPSDDMAKRLVSDREGWDCGDYVGSLELAISLKEWLNYSIRRGEGGGR